MNHVDNFGTNLTSNTSAGDTTSPLNSVPSISAPFYIAFDATNINGNYEVKQISSKTATNVLHSALAHPHTTAEEVRLIVPAREMDTLSSPPQGYMMNGKISVSVASNNITVAVNTLAGTDPSESSPVFVRIGDTLLHVTSALSVTKNAGTNWFNSGSAELATQEIDYFVYLGYNATDGVTIGFSRIPYANKYGDFSATSTNEKYCAISTIANAASTDSYEVIGRFAATLSAGAGYTWSVPTFTAANLIQRPIYETRWLSGIGIMSASSGTPTTTAATFVYRVFGNSCILNITALITNKGTASGDVRITVPFVSVGTFIGTVRETAISGYQGFFEVDNSVAYGITLKYDNTTFWVNSYGLSITITYRLV